MTRLRLTRGGLLALPATTVVGLVLAVGLGTTVAQSLGVLPVIGEPQPGLDAFRSVAREPGLLAGLRLSLMIATASTALALIVGVTAAVAIHRSAAWGRVAGMLATLTVPVSHLVGAAAVGLLLADSGLIARLVGADPNTFPALVAGPWWIAVVTEFAWKESAFVAIVVLATLAAEERDLTEAAATLGASSRQRLRRVTLPLVAPAATAAGGIAFAYVVGSHEVAWLLGQVYPEPLPVMAYRLSTDIDVTVRAQAVVVSVLTAAIAAASLALTAVLFRGRTVLR